MVLMQTSMKPWQVDADLSYSGEGWWLLMLQRDIDEMKAEGIRVGAHVTQLVLRMEAFAANAMTLARGQSIDRLAILNAVLQSYASEVSDETSDRADEWAERWQQWMQCYILPRGHASLDEEAIIVDESQVEEAEASEDFSAQQVAVLQKYLMANRKRRQEEIGRRKRAETERVWDDWAMFIELNRKSPRPRTRERTFVVKDMVRDVGVQTGHSNASSSTDAWRPLAGGGNVVPANASNCSMVRAKDEETTEEWTPQSKGRKAKRVQALLVEGEAEKVDTCQVDSCGVKLVEGPGAARDGCSGNLVQEAAEEDRAVRAAVVHGDMEASQGVVAGSDGVSAVGEARDGDVALAAADGNGPVHTAVVGGEMEVSLSLVVGIDGMSEVGDAPDGVVASSALVRDGDGAAATVVDDEGVSGETEGMAGLMFEN